MQLTPLIAVHMTAAIGAVALGPVALWARKSATQRPKLHRAFGYAWVTLIDVHRKRMTQLYIGACLVAGGFTLLPNRFLGNLIFHQWLALADQSLFFSINNTGSF